MPKPLARRVRARPGIGGKTVTPARDTAGVDPELIAEVAARIACSPARVRFIFDVLQKLSDPELAVVGQLSTLAASGIAAETRAAYVAGLSNALDSFARGDSPDPLREVDDELDPKSEGRVTLAAESASELDRARLLASSIGAADASRRIGRSRQALERLRREGRVLALRVGRQWRYPRWQFEPDAAGGVLPGLGEVLRELGMSPAGAAAWLTRQAPALGKLSPIEALRRNRKDAVVGLATELGHMP